MPEEPPNCSEICQKHSGSKHNGSPYAGAVTFVITFTALMTCILAFISLCCLPENSSPPALQFFLTTLLAVFVLDAIIFQIVVSNNQWKAMQNSLERTDTLITQSEKHFNALNRPIINIEQIKWDKDRPRAGMNKGKFWRVFVEIRNFGNTIAHVVLHDATLRIIPHVATNETCPKPIPSPRPKDSKMTVAAKHTFTLDVFTEAITPEDYVNLWTEDWDKYSDWKRMALWIDLSYKDHLGKDYIFRYHSIFNWVGFAPCSEHSEAT